MDFSGIFSELYAKLEGWASSLVLGLPNFVAAVLLVVLFALAARLVRRALHGVLRRASSYEQANRLLATGAYAFVLGLGLFAALGVLGLDKTVTSLLAGVGIVGLALGFAFQDLASNFIAGVLLSIRHPFRVGDIIETAGHFGTVEEINLRATWVRTFQGQRAIIPNKEVFQNPVLNYSLGHRRVDLRCGVSYGDDLEAARRVALAAIEALEVVDRERPVDLYFEEFGESAITFVCRFWIPYHKRPDYLGARSEAIIAIKRAFEEAGLTIPFPTRTLELGAETGARLGEEFARRPGPGGGDPPR